METQSMELVFEMEAFSEFLSTYPAYKDTMVVDSLRREEYPHLDEKRQACLDYTGVGLFSSSQKRLEFNGGAAIGLSHISSNLATHAMYTEEDSTESYFRKRILRYLNLDEDEYYIVFTANAFSAFKLLGASYPFHEAPNLLLAYDHRCENADAISECSLANPESIALSLPWCKIDEDDLKKKLQCKKKVSIQKVGMNKGLFAFPYSSRVTGCRSSSSWISQAQKNGWHVLLDVTSMDAKMLDSLGLSLCLPDFVICSFYNVFGEDPTGLGCLAIKRSVLRTLGDSSRARAIGMVKILNKQASSLIPSDSLLPFEHKSEHTNDARVLGPTGDSLIRSPPERSLLFQPEWSVDLAAIDNNLFYQSNGSDAIGSKAVLHRDLEVAHGLMKGKGSSYANPSQLHTRERGKGALDGDMNMLDGVLDHRESTSANSSQVQLDCRSKSFSMWMADQLVLTGSSGSISARDWDKKDFHFPTSRNHVAFLQDEIGVGPRWKNRVSQIQEIEPSYACSSDSKRGNGQSLTHVHPEPLTSRNLKGLLYSDFGPKHSVDRTSLRRLFKYETKAGVAEHLQRAGEVYLGEVLTVDDWMTFYASRSRVWNSNSSITSSSAPSSHWFDMEDWLEGDDRCTKAAGASTQSEVTCKGLDHADMLGYKRIATRLRSLADWLISSLSRLQHPPPKCFKVVKLCSQMSLADWGSTVAFTLLDSSGNAFDVKRVQLLADRNNISIRTGVIEGTLSTESLERVKDQEEFMVRCMERPASKCCSSKGDTAQRLQLPVLYVSLGFLNNFSDVYRLWRFVCRFLDPQFVDQELWHYQALNQETIEI